MENITVPIEVKLPENWADEVVKRLKASGDYVRIIRCRDCVWHNRYECAMWETDRDLSEDSYCSFAEKTEEDMEV